jgi:hypothetical protein
MLDDHPGGWVHPPTGRHAKSEYLPVPAWPASVAGEPGQPRRDPAEHLAWFWRISMRDAFPSDNPSPQVNQCQRGMPQRDMHSADDRPRGVDIHRHMRAPLSRQRLSRQRWHIRRRRRAAFWHLTQ